METEAVADMQRTWWRDLFQHRKTPLILGGLSLALALETLWEIQVLPPEAPRIQLIAEACSFVVIAIALWGTVYLRWRKAAKKMLQSVGKRQ